MGKSPVANVEICRRTIRPHPPDDAALEQAVPDFMRYAQVLDDHLAEREYVACARLTIADFQLASMATWWRQSQMPMSGFAHIVRWIDSLNRLPAWADPWPRAC